MADYTITFARSARKQLERIDIVWVRRIFPAIEALAVNPRPPSCKKLKGYQNLWRIRVGDYRVVYSIDDLARTVDVSAVRHRSEVYRD